MRYPALQGKRDANEPEIIAALESAYSTVEQIPTGKGVTDLLVGAVMACPCCGHRKPENLLMEVKIIGGKLNKVQKICTVNGRGRSASCIHLKTL